MATVGYANTGETGLPRLRPPGYTQGAAVQPMQRPMAQPTRPDAIRPPQGGPGTAAPPTLAVRPPAVGPTVGPVQRPSMPPAVLQQPQQPMIQRPVQPMPGGAGENRVPLSGVGSMIERNLASPTRFDLPAFKSIYDFAKGDLQQEADRSRQGAIADAARRGVFHSDAPDTMTGGFRDIGERYNRGLGSLTSSLALEAARTGQGDFNSALGNAFRFMENQQGADQFAANLGLNAANLGYSGAPNIAQILAQISGQPLPGLGPNPLEALGSTLANLQPVKKAA